MLAVYCMPAAFFKDAGYSLDGAWVMALGYAARKGLTFGRDIVFTYGPLGFFSTRYAVGSAQALLLLADAFCFAGYYHLARRYLVTDKLSFALALLSAILLRNTIYAQSLYLLFTVYVCLNFRNKFSNNFELVFTALAAVILFFCKVNYALIALPPFALVIVITIIKDVRKALLWLILPAATLFGIIYCSVHINISGYIQNSLPIIAGFDEAMFTKMEPSHPAFLAALSAIAMFAILLALYVASAVRHKKPVVEMVVCAVMFAAALYLAYRNGFTRADVFHYKEYFFTVPFLLCTAAVIFHVANKLITRVIVAVSIACSCYVLIVHGPWQGKSYPAYAQLFSPVNYFAGIGDEPVKDTAPMRRFDGSKVQAIGNATIDILPWETAFAITHGLNYSPRPVPQSYSVYAEALDRLNAAHFAKGTRPGIVLIQNESIDYHYSFWIESITKAAIALNYMVTDSVSVNGHHSLDEPDPGGAYLFLRSRAGSGVQPVFQPIRSVHATLGDTVQLDFNPDEPIYIKADLAYTTQGKLRRLFYVPPAVSMTLVLESGARTGAGIALPTLRAPVLINKYVTTNADLKNFLTGHVAKNKTVKAFCLHSPGSGLEQDYTLTFYRFANYPPVKMN